MCYSQFFAKSALFLLLPFSIRDAYSAKVSEAIPQQHTGSKIRVLSDIVASRIAAGEVVERPVAVVKELVENSLDAGACRIDVSFADGGRRFVCVDDNGCGMCPEDALLSLERHATSKLRDVSDLASIHSFGFRGEALPSISSVSRFTLRTRAEDRTEGSEIFVNNGKIVSIKAVGMPCGTRIEVAHLFESVPARRKFLKSDRTESAHIVLCCRLLAIAHPGIAFSLSENSRIIFQSPPCKTLSQRVGEIFGSEYLKDLFPISASDEGVRVSGLLSRPGKGRSNRSELFWFANLRPVENRTLSSATLEACRGFIRNGHFPAGFLFIEVDPAALDVNVHPAKREIRFRDEIKIRSFVMDAILEEMEKLAHGKIPEIGGGKLEERAFVSRPNAVLCPTIFPPVRIMHPVRTPPVTNTMSASRNIQPPPSIPGESLSGSHPTAKAVAETPRRFSPPVSSVPSSNDLPARWRYIGISHGNFILFETPDGILVLNRQIALVRILYEEYLRNMTSGKVVMQTLLFPRLFELRPLAAEAFEKNLPFFQNCGFGVEHFGADSFKVTTLPLWFRDEGCEEFFRSAAEKILENGMRPDRDENLARDTFARLAALHAARTDSPFDEETALDLARRLFSCRNPLADPKGNPTFIELNKNKLTGGS